MRCCAAGVGCQLWYASVRLGLWGSIRLAGVEGGFGVGATGSLGGNGWIGVEGVGLSWVGLGWIGLDWVGTGDRCGCWGVGG